MKCRIKCTPLRVDLGWQVTIWPIPIKFCLDDAWWAPKRHFISVKNPMSWCCLPAYESVELIVSVDVALSKWTLGLGIGLCRFGARLWRCLRLMACTIFIKSVSFFLYFFLFHQHIFLSDLNYVMGLSNFSYLMIEN